MKKYKFFVWFTLIHLAITAIPFLILALSFIAWIYINAGVSKMIHQEPDKDHFLNRKFIGSRMSLWDPKEDTSHKELVAEYRELSKRYTALFERYERLQEKHERLKECFLAKLVRVVEEGDF